VEIGVVAFVTDEGASPGALAVAVEERGLDALFVTEHTHLPVEHGATPWGSAPGREYGRTLDPWVTLAVAADRTTSITIGTAVSLVAQHDPISLAKAVATVDHLSGGRVVLGVGFGWCRPEVEDHGVAFASRREVVADHVAAMRALWQPEPQAFDGATVSFGAASAHPKPLGAGRPLVLLGAPASARTFDHLVRWADGWMPSDRPTLLDDLERARRRLDDAGRDAGRFPVTVVGAAPTAARTEALRAAGVDRILWWLPAAPATAVMEALDRLAQLRADVV
jgi:probable F420-dependent oxidoreductase